jgi:hypothetical protein
MRPRFRPRVPILRRTPLPAIPCSLPSAVASAPAMHYFRRGPILIDPTEPQSAETMALSRSSSWKEHRLANKLDVDGTEYSVDLVARKATGVDGWKATLVYLPRGEGTEVKVELPNAASTAEVRRLVTELQGADDRLRDYCRQG